MPLRLGGTSISKLYLGSVEIAKAYLGAVQIFSSAPALATAMRVRESVGNSEADIPLAVDGYVDETALTTHTGAASGFVTNWHDQSGSNNDATQGTMDSQPRIVNAGTVDEALVFDGTNDFLSTGARVTTGTVEKLFVSAWVKIPSSATSTYFEMLAESGLADQIGWIIYHTSYLSAGKLAFLWSNGGTNSTFSRFDGNTVFVDNTWHHIAVRKNGSSVAMWVDGISQTLTTREVNGGTDVYNTPAPLRISKNTNGLNGSITDVRVYEGAAADTAAANIAGIYAGTYEGSPVAWYKATEKSHSMRVRESSGNAERNILIADGGYVDETDLLDHVGANSGFVTSWQDRSGLGNHAVQTTQVSQPRIVNAGTVDEALVFDGANDFLSAGKRVTTGAVTKLFVSAWIKSEISAASQLVVGENYATTNNRAWAVTINNLLTGKLSFSASIDGLTGNNSQVTWESSSVAANGSLVHVAVMYDSGSVSMWINGESQTVTQLNTGSITSIFNSTAHLGIGANNIQGTANLHFPGSITDVRVAEGAAADDHAANIAGIYAGTYEGSPVAWYKATEITP